MTIKHGFPPGNTRMSYLDRQFFILSAQVRDLVNYVKLAESGRKDYDLAVDSGTTELVMGLAQELDHLAHRIAEHQQTGKDDK